VISKEEHLLNSRYRDSGVDIDAANRAKKKIGALVQETWGANILSEIGNFGGLYRLPAGYEQPVLVSSVDGVGTKLKVAVMAGRHDTVGEDLVNHCVNDILVQGAEPLFFLDYFACGTLEPDLVAAVVEGLARGCRENGCALIGGETAEMPGFYSGGEYDLAGCIVGIVERSKIIDGKRIEAGDEVWALPSSGLHTNGYSLARRIIFDEVGLDVRDEMGGTGMSVADALLAVHRSYLAEFRALRDRIDIRGLAHITGGGLLENIPRILPAGCAVEIDTASWDVPPLFRFLEERGRIERREMYRVFNMGIGMVLVVPAGMEDRMTGEGLRWKPFRIGSVTTGDRAVRLGEPAD
jgi:phosphoribosylformylglycinamidine cyclo-ligase